MNPNAANAMPRRETADPTPGDRDRNFPYADKSNESNHFPPPLPTAPMARTKHYASRPRARPRKLSKYQRENEPTQSPASPPMPRSDEAGTSRSPRVQGTPRRGVTQATPTRGGKKQKEATGRSKKTYKFRPGTVALREIRKFQKSVDLLIPSAPFIRTVREITNFYSKEVCRWTAEALLALQEAAEDHIIHLLGDAYLCSIHAKRVTLMRRDLELARRIGGGRHW